MFTLVGAQTERWQARFDDVMSVRIVVVRFLIGDLVPVNGTVKAELGIAAYGDITARNGGQRRKSDLKGKHENMYEPIST